MIATAGNLGHPEWVASAGETYGIFIALLCIHGLLNVSDPCCQLSRSNACCQASKRAASRSSELASRPSAEADLGALFLQSVGTKWLAKLTQSFVFINLGTV